jgi:hypothetical protein
MIFSEILVVPGRDFRAEGQLLQFTAAAKALAQVLSRQSIIPHVQLRIMRCPFTIP